MIRMSSKGKRSTSRVDGFERTLSECQPPQQLSLYQTPNSYTVDDRHCLDCKFPFHVLFLCGSSTPLQSCVIAFDKYAAPAIDFWFILHFQAHQYNAFTSVIVLLVIVSFPSLLHPVKYRLVNEIEQRRKNRTRGKRWNVESNSKWKWFVNIAFPGRIRLNFNRCWSMNEPHSFSIVSPSSQVPLMSPVFEVMIANRIMYCLANQHSFVCSTWNDERRMIKLVSSCFACLSTDGICRAQSFCLSHTNKQFCSNKACASSEPNILLVDIEQNGRGVLLTVSLIVDFGRIVYLLLQTFE